MPALLTWHEAHDACRLAAAGAAIPAHGLLEAYAVLTRLPGSHRLARDAAAQLLEGWFGDRRVLAAPAGLQRSLVRRLAQAGIDGGATYDALVAVTAAARGERLLTRDRPAMRTYGALGVPFDVVDG